MNELKKIELKTFGLYYNYNIIKSHVHMFPRKTKTC